MTPPENISKPYLFISIFILNHISYNAKLIIVLKKGRCQTDISVRQQPYYLSL